jgi:hypothetical protein
MGIASGEFGEKADEDQQELKWLRLHERKVANFTSIHLVRLVARRAAPSRPRSVIHLRYGGRAHNR